MKNNCLHTSRKAWLAIVMATLVAIPALAQKITVTGTVYEPDGEPAIGVSVMVQGQPGVGVNTDIDGNFKLEVDPNATLDVSYVGYETQHVPVEGRTHIDITLSTQSKALEEVVVIGYGTVKKEDATGSVSVVKPDEIEAGLATTAQDMLVGASPGVVVTTGADPYGSADIRIRGGSSLSASNDPLIVIDGVPMENGSVKGSSNPLALVSPENIESMTILKDASATAIFGSRASNGVIIITTKKGQSGKPQVNFSANLYINHARKTMDMMSSSEFADFVRANYPDSEQFLGVNGTLYSTNWQDQVLRTSVSSDYSLSVGGTVGWLPYRVAVSYTNNNGVIKTTSMDRATASINLTPKFFDGLLSINANVKGSYIGNQYEQGCLGAAVSFNPTLPIYMPGGNVFNNYVTYGSSGLPLGADAKGTDMSNIFGLNPVSLLNDYQCKSEVYQSVGNIQFDLKMPFLQELRANLNLGYEYNHGNVNNYNYPFSPSAWKSGHYIPGDDNVYKDGYASKYYEKQKRYNLLLDFYLNYNKEFSAINSSVDVTAGYSWQKFVNKGSNWSIAYAPGESFNGYQRDATYYYSSPYQLVSFFGRLQYSLAHKYLLTATVRRDGSSRFSKDHRWGTFPSVAIAWRILDENFMEGAKQVMNDLKIRGTWGITGQQDLGSSFSMLFPYLPIYSVSTSQGQKAPFGNYQYYLVTPQNYNSELKWEETTTWNVGLDFAFLNNRISGSFDYYYRKTKDLLTTTTYNAGSNLGPDGPMNIGDLTNHGIEFNIVTRPVVTKDFQWTSSLNIAWNKNEISTLAEGADIYTGSIGNSVNVQIQREGEAAFSYFVFEQVYNADGTPAEGVYVDRNGDGQITEDDKYVFHSRDPKVTINWQNTINYKNWDFGIVLRASLGNWMYNKNMADNCFGGETAVGPLGNLLSQDFCYIFNSAKSTNLLCSDYFVQNASFLRCDNISVGYTWPKLLNCLRLRLFAAVQNPFVITKYKGTDPEVFSGIDSSPYPRSTTYTLGLVATF